MPYIILYFIILLGVVLVGVIHKYGKPLTWSQKVTPLLMLSIITTIDLAVNFVTAGSYFDDGIKINGFLSKLIIVEDSWSLDLFKGYYMTSMYITLAIFLMYCIMFFVDSKKLR
nr:hypothetical protein [Sedimentibacter sp.]